MIIIYEGSEQDFWTKLGEVVEKVINANETRKVSPLSKVEACQRLGIAYKTLMKVMQEMNLTDIYPSDINRILLKYPKYINKSNINQ
ncbi:MAG: hypothetical protein WAO52_18915 [Prolixibacteraceae bacterium]